MESTLNMTSRLIDVIGLRRDPPARDWRRMYNADEFEPFVDGIARYMGLPIRADVSFLSPGMTFGTKALSTTNEHGQGVSGIAAQISIPSSLPMYGSSALDGYKLNVQLSESFRVTDPDTAITVLAHELSHVLLFALRHPEAHNEKLTDLVPIVLGPGHVVESGRKVHKEWREGDMRYRQTMTLGYLSADELRSALGCVEKTYLDWCSAADSLDALFHSFRIAVDRLRVVGARYREYLAIVDAEPQFVRAKNGAALVRMHGVDYDKALSDAVSSADELIERVTTVLPRRNRRTTRMPQQLVNLENRLRSQSEHLARTRALVESDVRLLRRSMRWRHRLRTWLRELRD